MGKILLVEDDPIESRMYANLLKKQGFEIRAISTGKTCRDVAREFQPSLIVLDIMMPEMNGFETLDVLRFDPYTHGIPVLVLTNLSDDHYKKEALRRGATEYLVKSNIGNADLLSVITDIMRAYEKPSSS